LLQMRMIRNKMETYDSARAISLMVPGGEQSQAMYSIDTLNTWPARSRAPVANVPAMIGVGIFHVLLGYLLLTSAPVREAVEHAAEVTLMIVRAEPARENKPIEPSLPVPVAKPLPVRAYVPDVQLDLPTTTSAAPAPVRAPEQTITVASGPAKTAAPTEQSAPPRHNDAVQPPRFDADYLDNPAPNYPALSRRSGEQGKVLLRVFVEPGGTAGQVLVVASSGFERLDSAAIDAVRRWKFVPAKQGENVIAAWVVVPINFSLKG
jgi:periplasmic protein TonB